ncbi:MAG: cellulase [Deltaproteobacteria bacterium]|nr:cellulase [Deltaproteobacteria bacterium]
MRAAVPVMGLMAIVLGGARMSCASEGGVRDGDVAAGEARGGCSADTATAGGWPLWEAYKARFVEASGRVVDHAAGHSTSEGQAYGLFHALVARDRVAFEAILGWADRELAGGRLGERLPAWRWVMDAQGQGRIADANAASDADLIIAYALAQGARVFGEASWSERAKTLLGTVAAREVKAIPGLGKMLLPGPFGFDTTPGIWRLNPSYQPITILRWAARFDPKGPWGEVLASSLRLAEGVAPRGLYPDWAAWSAADKGFVPDPEHGGRGSYDAIRAYLWPALMSADDPARRGLLAAGAGLLRVTRARGFVPERVEAWDAGKDGEATPGPVGFVAVAAAVARAEGDLVLAERLDAEVAAAKRGELYGEPAFYYDQNLLLFAEGHREGRYRFRADGDLELAGEWRCD